ncbi:MAG: hypothetical protein ACYTGR_13660 [Planctomycetota bacterium]|jgi:hypothetical protein
MPDHWHLWERLDARCRCLLFDDPETPQRVRAPYAILFHQSVSLAEEFIMHLVENRMASVADGRAAAHFESLGHEPTDDELVNHLLAFEFVRLRAIDFMRRDDRRRRLYDIDEQRDAPDGATGLVGNGGGPGTTGDEGTNATPRITIEDALHALCPDGTTVAFDTARAVANETGMAAMQALSRLAATQPGRDLLEAWIESAVTAHASSNGNGAAVLDIVAREIAAGVAAIDGLMNDVHEMLLATPGMEPHNRNHHLGRLDVWEIDRIFRPLDAARVQRLLSLPTPNAAQQRLSRYWRKKHELFECLALLVAQHLDDPDDQVDDNDNDAGGDQ